MDYTKGPIQILLICLFTIVLFSCSNSQIEVKEVEIDIKKDTVFHIYQNLGSISTLILDVNGKIDTDSSLLFISFENSKYEGNREIRDTINLKKGIINLKEGQDLFEPYFVLYYKNKKAKEGELNVKIKMY